MLQNPFPLAAEVNPVHGIIERIGYSVRRRREILLAVEVSEHYRWWLMARKGILFLTGGFFA